MIQQLINLQQEIHQWARDKGFWEDGQNRNKGEMVMLMVSELGEAVEAHRKHKTTEPYRFETYLFDLPHWDGEYQVAFEKYVKDTIEDELADVTIRILDYTAGWQIPVLKCKYIEPSTENFAHDVLLLCKYCLFAFELEEDSIKNYDWGYVLAAIIKFCEWYNINLLQHIEWKMRYNHTRPYRHGKAY